MITLKTYLKMKKSNGKKPNLIFYDEAGDIRLMSEAERLNLLKVYQEAKQMSDDEFFKTYCKIIKDKKDER